MISAPKFKSSEIYVMYNLNFKEHSFYFKEDSFSDKIGLEMECFRTFRNQIFFCHQPLWGQGLGSLGNLCLNLVTTLCHPNSNPVSAPVKVYIVILHIKLCQRLLKYQKSLPILQVKDSDQNPHNTV